MMFLFKSFVLWPIFFLLPVCLRAESNLDAFKANSTDSPWLVSLQVHGWHSCVGSIIGRKWILTTAFCVADIGLKTMNVRVGSPSYRTNGTIIPLKRLIPYEKYISAQRDHDFGLIELAESLNYTKNIQPISLPSANKNNLKDGELCTVNSWGMKNNIVCNDTHQESIVSIVNHDYCNRTYKSIQVITQQMICVFTTAKQTCRDAYGSPLTCREPKTGILQLIGLMSWSNRCADPNCPDVYAYAADSVRSWISKETGI